MITKVKGLSQLFKNWWNRSEDKQKRLEIAMVQAGLLIQAESQKQTPVDTGALRGNHDTIKKVSGTRSKSIEVHVVVTQSYAIYVHERLDLRHAPGTNAKFLENALRTQRPLVMKLIKQALQ